MIFVFLFLTSLCLTGSRFIYLIRTESNLFLFMAEYYSTVYMYHNFYTHSSVNGHICWEELSLNHWNAREVTSISFLDWLSIDFFFNTGLGQDKRLTELIGRAVSLGLLFYQCCLSNFSFQLSTVSLFCTLRQHWFSLGFHYWTMLHLHCSFCLEISSPVFCLAHCNLSFRTQTDCHSSFDTFPVSNRAVCSLHSHTILCFSFVAVSRKRQDVLGHSSKRGNAIYL